MGSGCELIENHNGDGTSYRLTSPPLTKHKQQSTFESVSEKKKDKEVGKRMKTVHRILKAIS